MPLGQLQISGALVRSTTASGPKLFHKHTRGRYGTVRAHACRNANHHLHRNLPVRASPATPHDATDQTSPSSVGQVPCITGFDVDWERLGLTYCIREGQQYGFITASVELYFAQRECLL